MPEKRYIRAALRLALTVLALAALRWLVPCFLPLLLALAFSSLLERPVRFLSRHLSRRVAAGICTLLSAILLTGALAALLWRLGLEGAALAGRLPALVSGLDGLFSRLRRVAERLSVAVPVSLRALLDQALEQLSAQALDLAGRLPAHLAELLVRWASALPSLALFLFTTTLATFFASAGRPALLAFLGRQIPEAWRPFLTRAAAILRGAFSGWLRAQGLLMLVTFAILSAGLLLLQVDLALLCAALTAVLDALPVLGVGIVLMPWAAISLLRGRFLFALGLLLLYGVLALVRSLLEPRLVGRDAGLPPLAALTAMYAGFVSFGAAGMLLFPLAAVLLKGLHDQGLIHLWR